MSSCNGHGQGGEGHSHRGGREHGGHGSHADEGGEGDGHGQRHADGGHGHAADLATPLLKEGGGGGHEESSVLREEQAKLKKAVYLALLIMFVEIVGGVFANSLAIITDAAHMLSDVGGFIVSLVCLQLAAQGVTTEYTFGFKQAEVLGALLSITIVWALTAVLLWTAAHRFFNLEEINAPYMFGISTLGFLVNLVLMKVLGHNHGGGDCGGHGHSHGDSIQRQTSDGSHGSHVHDAEQAGLAMQAAIAHVVGDIVQSLGVCLASLCIWLQPFDVGVTAEGVSKWNYADPMCTVLFGILVLFTTKKTLTQTIDSLMVKAPEHIDQTRLLRKLGECPSVKSVHDLHVWSLGSKDVLCTAHLMVEGRENTTSALVAAIEQAKRMGIGHSTFQIEVLGEFDPTIESYGIHANPMAAAGKGHAGHGGGHGGDGGHSCSGHAH